MICLHCKDNTCDLCKRAAEINNRPDVLTRTHQKALLERIYAEMNMLKPGGFE